MKTAALWLLRVLLAVAAIWVFFGWAVLVNSEPLSDLAADQIPAEGVPTWAKSLHVNHGAVVFNSFGISSEDPWHFALPVAVSVIAVVALIFSFPRDARSKFLAPLQICIMIAGLLPASLAWTLRKLQKRYVSANGGGGW